MNAARPVPGTPSAWWLVLAIVVAAVAAYDPRVGAGVIAAVVVAAAWRWPDRVQAVTVWFVLALRPSLDIFSQRWLGLEQFALSPSVVFGLLVLVVTVGVGLRRGANGLSIWPDRDLRYAHGWLIAGLAAATGAGLWWYGGVGASNGVRELARALSAVAAMLLVMWWATQDPRRYRRGWVLLVAGVVPPVVVALWQWVTGTGNLDTEGLNRLQGTFSHPNTLGPFLVPFILVAIASAQRGYATARIMRLAAAAGLTVIVALTYSRTGILVLLMALGTLPILQARHAGWRELTRAGFVLIVFALGAWLMAGDYIRERFADLRIDAVTFKALEPGMEENTLQWRVINWVILVGVAMNHWIAGHGLALTTVVNPMTDFRTGIPINAHNDFVRFLVEGGIIGLVCYAVYACVLSRWAMRQARAVPPDYAATALAPAATLLAMIFLTAGAAEFSSQTAIQYELGAMLGLLTAIRRDNRAPALRTATPVSLT